MPKKNHKIFFIDLPKKARSIYISVIFQHGYYDETNSSFGISHLLEHLLSEQIQKVLDTDAVYASINDKSIRFDITTSRKNVYNHLKKTLSIVLDLKIDNKSIIEREKARMRIELHEKYGDFYKWIESEVLKVIIKSPSYIKRSRSRQIKNLENFTIPKLVKAHANIIKKPLIIFVAGYKIPTSDKKELSKILESKTAKINLIKENKYESVSYVKNKKSILKHPIIEPGYVHQSIIFPAFALQNSSLSDRFALGLICKELSWHLTKSLGEIGVYKVDYEYRVRENYGFVRFFSFVPKKHENLYQKIILEGTKNILKQLTKKKIKEFKTARRRNLQNTWENNLSHIDWIIDDILDFGQIKTPNNIQKELEKLTPKKLSFIAKKIFNKSKISILTVKSGQIT